MSAGSKEGLLDSLVSKEVTRISPKLEFWGANSPINKRGGWESATPIQLAEFLDKVKFSESELETEHTRLLYCIAWEFSWGKQPPEIVREERKSLIQRANQAQQLSDLESLWYKLIRIDTDMF